MEVSSYLKFEYVYRLSFFIIICFILSVFYMQAVIEIVNTRFDHLLQSNTFSLVQKERKNTPPFGRGAVRRQFSKPDIFTTTITTCSSGQKAGLTQNSSSQSLELSVHTNHKGRRMSHVTRIIVRMIRDKQPLVTCPGSRNFAVDF